jgi:hypothetical protein
MTIGTRIMRSRSGHDHSNSPINESDTLATKTDEPTTFTTRNHPDPEDENALSKMVLKDYVMNTQLKMKKGENGKHEEMEFHNNSLASTSTHAATALQCSTNTTTTTTTYNNNSDSSHFHSSTNSSLVSEAIRSLFDDDQDDNQTNDEYGDDEYDNNTEPNDYYESGDEVTTINSGCIKTKQEFNNNNEIKTQLLFSKEQQTVKYWLRVYLFMVRVHQINNERTDSLFLLHDRLKKNYLTLFFCYEILFPFFSFCTRMNPMYQLYI